MTVEVLLSYFMSCYLSRFHVRWLAIKNIPTNKEQVVTASATFRNTLRFSPLLKNQHFQIPIDSEKPRPVRPN